MSEEIKPLEEVFDLQKAFDNLPKDFETFKEYMLDLDDKLTSLVYGWDSFLYRSGINDTYYLLMSLMEEGVESLEKAYLEQSNNGKFGEDLI